MSLLGSVISLAVHFLNIPFSPTNNQNLETSIRLGRQVGQNQADAFGLPINFLRNTGLANCNLNVLKVGENQINLSALPRGICSNCCPFDPKKHVRFSRYTVKKGQLRGFPIKPFNEPGSANHSGIDRNVETVIFVHGFTEPSPGESGKLVAEAYLSRKEPYNVILVDWSHLGAFPWYQTAVQNTRLVGMVLEKFLRTFHESGEIPIENVHLIGFSLGAHIVAHTGKAMSKDLKLKRITALDPAFPEFSLDDPSHRLSSDDAEYVDVIHTDGGILGFPLSLGHTDFYPNGGRALQPGCQPSELYQRRLVDQVVGCSHVRAWRLYAESVRNPKAFPSTSCKVWRGPEKECEFRNDAYMGFPSNRNFTGEFYLLTNKESPYSRSEEDQRTSTIP